jgi:hypothetical protein
MPCGHERPSGTCYQGDRRHAGGPIGLVAGVITQGAVEKHHQNMEKQRFQDLASSATPSENQLARRKVRLRRCRPKPE